MDKPLPPISADVDLKDFAFTPIYRARLFGSAFHATASDAAWRAGVTLWLKSWDQVPAGSLPTDEVALCRLAELGRDLRTWRKISFEALHGWGECSDGRLYHKVVSEGVEDAWQRKLARRDRTEAARVAKAAKRLSQSIEFSVTESVTDPLCCGKALQGTGTGTGTGTVRKKEASEAIASGADAPAEAPDPVKELWDRGVAILGGKHRSLLAKLCKEHGEPAVLEAIVACESKQPVEPASFLMACLARAGPKMNGQARQSPVEKLYLGAMRAAEKFDELDRQSGNRGADCQAPVALLDRRRPGSH